MESHRRGSRQDAAVTVLQLVLDTLVDLNTTELRVGGGGASSDTKWWVAGGVPGAELFSYNENYHIYHHTHRGKLHEGAEPSEGGDIGGAEPRCFFWMYYACARELFACSMHVLCMVHACHMRGPCMAYA